MPVQVQYLQLIRHETNTAHMSSDQDQPILDFAEARDDGVEVALAGLYANHFHDIPDR